jgi:hypothetical protein
MCFTRKIAHKEALDRKCAFMATLCNFFHLWDEVRSELFPTIFNNCLHWD